MTPKDRIFVALDTGDLDLALGLAGALKGHVGGVKLGKEFFTTHGPDGVRYVAAEGLPVFLDLKFHDIPATVAGAVRSALALKPFMFNVHAAGGEAMMRAAVDAIADAEAEAEAEAEADSSPENHAPSPLLLAVTVLTSLWSGDLKATGIDGPVEDQVLRLTALARHCGLDGVVCSPREVAMVRREVGDDFTLVVPGIRPEWAQSDDQKRVLTPAETLAAGADYLVIGRPITGADNPAQAADRIAGELEP